MLTLPRWSDPAWWRAYAHDVRPRMLLLHVRADRVRLRWGVPAWALEEVLRAVLLVGPWALWVARCAPRPWRARWHGTVGGLAFDLREAAGTPPWPALLALLEPHAGWLDLPDGEPFVHIEADGAIVDVRPW